MSDVQFRVTDPDALTRAVAPIVELVARDLANAIAADTPVGETGNLKAGWRAEKRGDALWQVVNDVPYARDVEFGTQTMAPAAMMDRGLADARSRYGA